MGNLHNTGVCLIIMAAVMEGAGVRGLAKQYSCRAQGHNKKGTSCFGCSTRQRCQETEEKLEN
jgi:hypothetical protein